MDFFNRLEQSFVAKYNTIIEYLDVLEKCPSKYACIKHIMRSIGVISFIFGAILTIYGRNIGFAFMLIGFVLAFIFDFLRCRHSVKGIFIMIFMSYLFMLMVYDSMGYNTYIAGILYVILAIAVFVVYGIADYPATKIANLVITTCFSIITYAVQYIAMLIENGKFNDTVMTYLQWDKDNIFHIFENKLIPILVLWLIINCFLEVKEYLIHKDFKEP